MLPMADDIRLAASPTELDKSFTLTPGFSLITTGGFMSNVSANIISMSYLKCLSPKFWFSFAVDAGLPMSACAKSIMEKGPDGFTAPLPQSSTGGFWWSGHLAAHWAD